MHDSVTLQIDADPLTVWGLVSDITNTGRFSPETFEAEWLDDATGPAVGVRFRGHVRRNGRGPTYWTECRITECVPGETFEFEVIMSGDRVGNTWRYDLVGDGAGTRITESFQLPSNAFTRAYWAVAGRWRNRTNVEGMRRTLEAVKAVAEGA